MEMTPEVHQHCSKQNLAWEVNFCSQALFHTSPSSEPVSLGRQWCYEERGQLQEYNFKVSRTSSLFVTEWNCGWEQVTVFLFFFFNIK